MRITLRSVFILFFPLALSAMARAQDAAAVTGRWLSEEKDARIEIYQTGATFSGKIVWAKNPNDESGKPKKDSKNPDAKLRSRPLMGLVILTGFVYEDGAWENGKIYDPKSGKTYSSTMKLKDGRLEIRGYVGVSLLGRSTVWTRAR